MIRRISKFNDLKDIIASCPSGVIDDIYAIEYYIAGYEEGIEASFTKVNGHLEVILPTSQLQLLPNGILMRRAYYRVADSSYPDGYYNLEFEDSLNVWLGDDRGGAVVNEYVTDDELASTLSSYATQDWVGYQGFLTAETIPSDIATESYVQSALDGYATQSWVQSQGYITVGELPSGLATQSWVSTNFMRFDSTTYPNLTVVNTSNTEPLVFGYVSFQTGDEIMMVTAELNYDVDWDGPIFGQHWYSLVDGSWVEWRSFRRYAMEYEIEAGVYSYLDDHSYATQSWVSSQGYLTSVPSEYATQSWVASQNYLNASALSSALSGYATESYVDQAIEDAVFGSDGPDLQNILQYEPDNILKEQLDIDVIKRELDNGDEGNTAPYVLGQYVHSNGINTIQVDGNELIRVNYEEDQETGDLVETYREYIPYTDEEWDVVWNWYNQDLNDDDPLKDHGFVDVDFIVGRDDNGHFEGFGVVDLDGNGTVKVGRYTRDEVEDGSLYLYNENIDPFLAYHIDSNDEVVQNLNHGFLNLYDGDMDGNFYAGTAGVSNYFDGIKLSSNGILGHYWVEQEWVEGDGSDPEDEGYYEYTSHFEPYATQSWATSEFLEESKIWTGSQSAWEQLTSAQQALYTIALITD